jgi:hypothetical protein
MVLWLTISLLILLLYTAQCTRTLHVDPSNVKALSRRATARVALGDKTTALSDLKLVNAIML